MCDPREKIRNPVIYSCFWLVGHHQQGVAHLPSGVTELYRTCTCNFLCFEQHPMYMFVYNNIMVSNVKLYILVESWCLHCTNDMYMYMYTCISLTTVALSI